MTGQYIGYATNPVGADQLSSTLRTGQIPIPLASWRLIATNAIPAIAVASGNGGNLASDTAPKLERVNGATDKKLRIDWASSSSVEITADVVYPIDLDASYPMVIHVLAAMGGTSDTPTITFGVFEGVGGTDKGGATAAVTGTTVAEYTRSISVGAYPNAASIALTPGAHTTDTLLVYATWITYRRK